MTPKEVACDAEFEESKHYPFRFCSDRDYAILEIFIC